MSTRGSAWIARAMPEEKLIFLLTTPIELVKAVKTDVEVRGMRRACLNDGIALAVLFAWLEREMNNVVNPRVVMELDVIKKLEEVKQTLFAEEFVSASFGTIAGSGPHAAITNETNRRLNRSEVFLLDFLHDRRDSHRVAHRRRKWRSSASGPHPHGLHSRFTGPHPTRALGSSRTHSTQQYRCSGAQPSLEIWCHIINCSTLKCSE